MTGFQVHCVVRIKAPFFMDNIIFSTHLVGATSYVVIACVSSNLNTFITIRKFVEKNMGA